MSESPRVGIGVLVTKGTQVLIGQRYGDEVLDLEFRLHFREHDTGYLCLAQHAMMCLCCGFVAADGARLERASGHFQVCGNWGATLLHGYKLSRSADSHLQVSSSAADGGTQQADLAWVHGVAAIPWQMATRGCQCKAQDVTSVSQRSTLQWSCRSSCHSHGVACSKLALMRTAGWPHTHASGLVLLLICSCGGVHVLQGATWSMGRPLRAVLRER